MPYGSSTKSNPERLNQLQYGNSDGVYYVVTRVVPEGSEFLEYWNRTGLNSPNPNMVPLIRIPHRKVCKVVNIKTYTGRKLSYKLFNSKTGRYYYAREAVYTPRVKCYYPKLKKKTKKKKARLRYVQPNPLSYTESKTTYSGGTIRIGKRYDGYTLGTVSQLHSPFHVNQYGAMSSNISSANYALAFSGRSYLSVAEADHEALANFHEKLKNQSVNLGQVIAEADKTVIMFADIVKRIAKVLLSVKHSNIKAASEALFGGKDRVANDWLAIQYGIKPLLSDLDGLMEHLAVSEEILFTIKSRKTNKYPHQLDATDSYLPNFLVKSEAFCSGSSHVTYNATCRITRPALRESSRLGLNNLVTLAWELVPFSFVVDWFLPIGGYLNALDSMSGLEVLHVHKTVVRKERTWIERTYSAGYDSSGYKWESDSASSLTNKINVERSILTSIPEMPLPQFKNPITAVHIQNAVALLAQLKH